MEWYCRIYARNRYNRDRWVIQQASRVAPGSHVLDVGAGSGPYRHLFSHCHYRAHDFAQEPSSHGKYTTLDYVSDITSIPVPEDSFDVILCTEVLEHAPEPIKALSEFRRILRKKGLLLITAPLGSLLHQEPFHFYGGYTPYWYQKFLPETGFELQTLEPNGGFFQFLTQEALRFSALIDPRRTTNRGWLWFPLTLLWLLTFPGARLLLPFLATFLDQLRLENIATVGYHVVASKTESQV